MAALALAVSPLVGPTHAAAASPVIEPATTPILDAERTVTSTLMPGEALHEGESISSASGRYRLLLHRNGNLVLYDTAGAGAASASPPNPAPEWFDAALAHGSAPTALWDTRTAGTEADLLVMGDDGDLQLRSGDPATTPASATVGLVEPAAPDATRTAPAEALWNSRTADRPGAYLTVHDDGKVTIGYSDGRVLWTAGTSTPDVGLSGARHVVYDRTAQRVWLVEADGSLYDTYPVSGRATFPRPGSYEVFSKSRWSSSPKTPVTMEHMVRFVKGTAGLLDVGFHSIPRTYGNYPIQTVDELGQPRSAGCVRQDDAKAVQLYQWAPIGTPVVVIV
ncbi:L,D-transpeptidase [Candidatus Poriferisodalis sp.]|uniref:L,D-transpeptidase n=1 Tax=Candidatus Poriferisodalis sp. TaxID=3101277 RepID=UPI003B02DAA2